MQHLRVQSAFDKVEGLWVITSYGTTWLYEGNLTMAPLRQVLGPVENLEHVFGTFASEKSVEITTGRAACSSISCRFITGPSAKKKAQSYRIPKYLRDIWPIVHQASGCDWWMPENNPLYLSSPNALGRMVYAWLMGTTQ
jgi:hypothetical protein